MYKKYYFANEYMSLSRIARESGISHLNLKARVKRNPNVAVAAIVFDIKNNKPKTYFYKNRCRHLSDIADIAGVDKGNLAKWIKAGLTVTEAVERINYNKKIQGKI